VILLLAFGLALLDEWVAAQRTMAIADRRRRAAGLWSGVYVVVTAFWAYITVTNLWTVGPSAVGAMIGSWWATRQAV
jgi:hypothetical protein